MPLTKIQLKQRKKDFRQKLDLLKTKIIKVNAKLKEKISQEKLAHARKKLGSL